MKPAEKCIWTIGHSTRSYPEFSGLLRSSGIAFLADIRNYPGSARYPQFGKDVLQQALANDGIQYLHLKDLGGRRKARPDSKNTSWRNAAFRGYADYMETSSFLHGIEELETAAQKLRTAYMCSEAVWWSCHRALVSDYLKSKQWKVLHIMAAGKEEEHPYTGPARVVNGKLTYMPDHEKTGSLFDNGEDIHI